MRYFPGTLLTALVIAAALPAPGHTESADPFQRAAGMASNSQTTFQVREMAPGQTLSIALDHAFGVAYFTSEPGGFRLVATIRGTWGPSIRFVTMLAPDQTATVSVPRGAGEDPAEVSFLRQGAGVIVKIPSMAGH
jgi:hypothetical protein